MLSWWASPRVCQAHNMGVWLRFTFGCRRSGARTLTWGRFRPIINQLLLPCLIFSRPSIILGGLVLVSWRQWRVNSLSVLGWLIGCKEFLAILIKDSKVYLQGWLVGNRCLFFVRSGELTFLEGRTSLRFVAFADDQNVFLDLGYADRCL